MAIYVDRFNTEAGWRYTEDITFTSKQQMTFGLNGFVQSVPITFGQTPFQALNTVRDSSMAFLVFRHLDINTARPFAHRVPTWMWNQAVDTTFSAAASTVGGTITLPYGTGPSVSGSSLAVAVPLALRRLQLGTLPAGVTITKVQVKLGFAASFDDLHLTSPISGTIDFASYYDAERGIVNNHCIIGTTTQVIVQLTYNNTNGSPTSVPYQMYGQQRVLQFGQWAITFQPTGGQVYLMGGFNDLQAPTYRIAMDKLIPLQLTDTGSTNIGNLVFTATDNQMPWYGLTSTYDIMLTATIAYLISS